MSTVHAPTDNRSPIGEQTAVAPAAEEVPRWRLSRLRQTPERDIPVERHIVVGREPMQAMLAAMVANTRPGQILTVAPMPPVAVTAW